MFDRDLFMPSDIAAAFILIFQRGNVVHQSQTANNSEPDEDGHQIPRNEVLRGLKTKFGPVLTEMAAWGSSKLCYRNI